MSEVNEIIICKDSYKSVKEFKNAIKKAIMVLLDNDYIITVRYDEKGLGIVVIEYDYADRNMGGRYPYWLTFDEREE